MELKNKYQYTYFIYPYIVNDKKIDKYILKLIKNKNCSLKIFEKEKDTDIYKYFLPKIRDYMFWTFEFSKSRLDKLNNLDNIMKSTLISKRPCNIFEYDIPKEIQGKVGSKDGIFFSIKKMEIVCFNSGICFLLMKTMLSEKSTIGDLCNFNNEFRDINSSTYKFKDSENINIQTDTFKDVKGISYLIKEITGNNIGAKDLNLDTERFITYSYACVDQEDWRKISNEEQIEKEFYKFANIEPDNTVSEIGDFNKSLILTIENSQYIKYGCTNIGTVLLTSDVSVENYTKISSKYENEYLYSYIFELYKKIYLKKINKEFKVNNQFNEVQKEFINFTQKIWIESITNEDLGTALIEEWDAILKIKKFYSDVKQKYDLMYKNSNLEKTAKSNKVIIAILIILMFINVISCTIVLGK